MFGIAADAPIGTRQVTFENSAGKSNPIDFAIKSASLGPGFTSISPIGAVSGARNIPFQLTGSGLTGLTGFVFYGSVLGDRRLVASNVVVNAEGTEARATIDVNDFIQPDPYYVHAVFGTRQFRTGFTIGIYDKAGPAPTQAMRLPFFFFAGCGMRAFTSSSL